MYVCVYVCINIRMCMYIYCMPIYICVCVRWCYVNTCSTQHMSCRCESVEIWAKYDQVVPYCVARYDIGQSVGSMTSSAANRMEQIETCGNIFKSLNSYGTFAPRVCFFAIFLFGYENCSLGDTTLTELNSPPRSRWLSRPSRPAFAIQTKSGPQLEAVVFGDHLVGFLK